MAKVELLKTAFVDGVRHKPGIYDELPKGYDPKSPGAYRKVEDDGTPISDTEKAKDAAPMTTKGDTKKTAVKL
jgi:hypothetical protein